jgi:hypothetical protein
MQISHQLSVFAPVYIPPALHVSCRVHSSPCAATCDHHHTLLLPQVALFDPSDVPFADLAFSSISVTLRHYVAEAATGDWHVHHGVIDKRPGSAPNDPTSFELREHFALPLR